jgi:hypothetical protein
VNAVAILRAAQAVQGDEATRRAERLLDQWSVLSMQHVALGGACGCAMGGLSLRLDDFELDIVDYLCDAGVRSDLPEVVTFFTALQDSAQQGSAMGTRAQPLRRLLEQMSHGRLPQPVAGWLLPKVERTLQSYAELHGPRMEG